MIKFVLRQIELLFKLFFKNLFIKLISLINLNLNKLDLLIN